MKKMLERNKKILKKLLKEQAKVEKPDLSEDVRKLEELKALLKK